LDYDLCSVFASRLTEAGVSPVLVAQIKQGWNSYRELKATIPCCKIVNYYRKQDVQKTAAHLGAPFLRVSPKTANVLDLPRQEGQPFRQTATRLPQNGQRRVPVDENWGRRSHDIPKRALLEKAALPQKRFK